MGKIGDRIREAAAECGTVERMAELAGIPRRTLYNYLKGPREPKAAQIAAISAATGVELRWLITGEEPKFPRPSQSQSQTLFMAEVNPWAMERLYVLVEGVYREIGRPISGNAIAREAAALFNQLVTQVTDTRDHSNVENALPALAGELRRRLIAALPGSGKASAS